MNKSQLRQQFLQQRRALSATSYQYGCDALAEHFFNHIDLTRVRYLHSFLPINQQREIDTWRIIRPIWRQYPHIQLVAPRIRDTHLEQCVFTPITELSTNQWGIPEPQHGTQLTDIKQLDMVLLPLLCFDQYGHRVGYGKGFYDRFLARCHPHIFKVGLSLFDPVANIRDVNVHDVPMDACLTPRGKVLFLL